MNLIPLSHQHQHALALCLRIDRALQSGSFNLEQWQTEIHQSFVMEIRPHFEAEEQFLFPAARKHENLALIVEELLLEHALLRSSAAHASTGSLSRSQLRDFATLLSAHIRKEERELFEGCQEYMSPFELSQVGEQLSNFFHLRNRHPDSE